MQHSVRPTFLMMLGAFGVLCLAAAGIVLNWVIRRFVRKGWPPKWLSISMRAGIVAVAAVGVVGLAYGVFVEPYWVVVEHVRLESNKLPPGTRPIRIVQVADFHSERKERCEGRLPEIVAREHPDLIVYTGDAVNGAEGIPVFNRCMRRLAMLAPTFVIHGGNDGAYLSRGLFKGTGVVAVDREVQTVEVAGVRVFICGITNGRGGGVPHRLRSAPPEALKILLCHYPSSGARAVRGSGVDLCLAGNTHGGQVRLPFYGSAVGAEQDRKYLAGLFRVGSTWLYVNRGIGMSGAGRAIRFGARPEVTVVEITPPR